MISLTDQQIQALEQTPTAPLRIANPKTQETYILLRLDEFERLAHDASDATPWTDEERDLLRAEAVETLGWEGMEAYQDDEP